MKDEKVKISASFDRTIYPVYSVLHLQALLNKILENKPITFKIYDYHKNLIVTRKIYPYKRKIIRTLEGRYIIQTSVKMKGKKWKIGKQYTLVVNHSKEKSEDNMVIAKHNSVILTDKESYILGSDAIITIIAPDFDLDSEKAEIIGNKPDCWITISSSKGKLKGYKFRETGDSTGIFQGIIGFDPPKYSKDGKKLFNPKPRGKGPDDGYIPASIGENIVIKFKNMYEEISTSAFISDFGASIELDKKIYDWLDEVYLSVIAPDYNFNSNKIDSIGNKLDCKISISTSRGELINYRLKETDADSGIFIGKLKLMGNKFAYKKPPNRKQEISRGKGHTDGLLACSEKDKLVVKFITETKTYIAIAKIKPLG